MKKVFCIVAFILLLAPISVRAAGPALLNSPEIRAHFDMWRARINLLEQERAKTAKKKVIKKVAPATIKKTITDKIDPISPTVPIKDQTVGTPLQPSQPIKPNIVQYKIDEATKATTKASAIKANTTIQKSSSLLQNLGSAVWLSVEGAYNIIVSWLK